MTFCRYVTYKKDRLSRHAASPEHLTAIQAIHAKGKLANQVRRAEERHGDYITFLLRQLLFMVKQNHPLRQFPAAVENALSQLKYYTGKPAFPGVPKGYASYENPVAARDFLVSLSQVTEDEVWDSIRRTNFFSIMVDESTDISDTPHLIIYARFWDTDKLEIR